MREFSYIIFRIYVGMKKKKKGLCYIDYYTIKLRIFGEKNKMVSIYVFWLDFKFFFKKFFVVLLRIK